MYLLFSLFDIMVSELPETKTSSNSMCHSLDDDIILPPSSFYIFVQNIDRTLYYEKG